MRKIREILRQKWALGRTHREVAQSLSIGLGTVSGVERRARAASLRWTDVEGLADEALETRLYPPGPTGKGPPLAGLRLSPCRTPEAGGHPGAAAPRVSGAASGRVSVHPVL
jgi:hypothetical protein